MFFFRKREAELLKEELKQARLAEKIAKEKYFEVSRGSIAYPVSANDIGKIEG